MGYPRSNMDSINKYIDNNYANSKIKHIKGEIKMESTQVTAALGLLRKTLPDLAAITISGDQDKPFLVKDISDRPLEIASDSWLDKAKPIIEVETVQ